MTDDLDQKTDAELEADFAREVVQLGVVESHWGDDKGNPVYGFRPIGADPMETPWADVPPYCSSADAVLPWLEKTGPGHEPWIPLPRIKFMPFGYHGNSLGWNVDLGEHNKSNWAPTFARAAVLALIRAKRMEKKA